MSVGLFTTEIYANWVRKEELERWVVIQLLLPFLLSSLLLYKM